MFGLTPFNSNTITKSNRNDYLDLFNLMDNFFNESIPSTRVLRNDTFKIDVKDNEKAYLIDAELPGFKKEELQINMENDCLTISAEKSEENEETKDKYIHKERKSSLVKRTIYLKDVSPENIKASFENGLLTITVPKLTKESNTKAIEIE